MVSTMRKWCPNYDNEDGLETVLEVPVPEEMFANMGSNSILRWQNMRNLLKAQARGEDYIKSSPSSYPVPFLRNDQFMLLLKLIGSALIPYQVQFGRSLTFPINDGSIEASTAKYIVQQYLAATGGYAAHNVSSSMYAMGQVKMVTSDVPDSDQDSNTTKRSTEIGGFVLWQKNPDLWYLELVVSGYNVNAGSDGKVAWSQSSSNSNASRGPPRTLRRFFQGLDPRSTANLFLNAVCTGERTIKNEACFVLRLETSKDILRSQSTTNTEIVHHTIWGNFSQKTGLLVQFEDTKLVRIKSAKGDDWVFYETNMASVVEDYRYVDGLNIAHSGKTLTKIYRYGSKSNRKWKVEETWRIEEIDFDVCGLSMDCFLPPAEKEQGNSGQGMVG